MKRRDGRVDETRVNMKKTIRTIRKSQREQIRVGLSEFTKDGTMFNMVFARVFFDDGAKYRPARNGLNVRVELLPELIAALGQAEAEARAVGLLKNPEADSAAPTEATEGTEATRDGAGAGAGDLTILGGG